MLTLYLASPILVFVGLYVLIFVTLDKEKHMADSPAIGAGAGDTGDANALGQWLAGRDPDAVSLAAKAKRERLMIDPRDWPGGIELHIPKRLIKGDRVSIELRRGDQVESIRGEPGTPVRLTRKQVDGVTIWLVQPNSEDTRIFSEPRIPAQDQSVNEPMVIEIED